MNKNMGTWYRIAKLTPEHEILQKRCEAIDSFLDSSVDFKCIVDLVNAFYDINHSSEYVDDYVDHIIKIDSAFDCKNKVEISVLAGIALRQIIDDYDEESSSIVYLAVICASYQNKQATVPDIQQEIIQLFDDARIQTREALVTDSQGNIDLPTTKKLSEFLRAAGGTQWSAEASKAIADYLDTTNIILKKILEKNQKNYLIYSDDSQILWWLVGKWSNDFGKPYSELSKSEACIYAGKELADLVRSLPGPYSAKAVLSQIISNCKKTKSDITMFEIIKAADRSWVQLLLKKYGPYKSVKITPILYALSLYVQSDENSQWVSVFSKATGIDPRDKLSDMSDFAFHVYAECSLIKALDKQLDNN